MIKSKIVLPAMTSFLVLAGCTTTTPEVVKESHGDSVRNMIAEQTYTPEAEVSTMDGDKSSKVLDTYREDVGDAKQVEKQVLQLEFN